MTTDLRRYARLPAIANGYELDDQFSVVVPIARTNLVTNPSFETNTTSWTAIGGSIARSTVQQYHGAYSLAITPTAATTDGARFDTVSLTAAQLYAYSAKVLGAGGRSYKLAIETTGGVELASVVFVASGRWQWVSGYYVEISTTTRRVTLRKSGGTDTTIFYLDGVQVEAINVGERVSTYLDGDQQGFVPNQNPAPYIWNGTPHASTSARSGLTRAGGMVIPFKQFGFLLTAIIGLGLATPMNAHTEYARIDGGYDDFTRKPTRQLTLSGQFQAGLDYLQLRQQRGGLAQLLDRDLVGQDQRLMLKREVIDACDGGVRSSTCQIIGKYQGGLQGNTDNQIAEQTAISFTQYLPNVLSDGEDGSALAVQQSVANANYIQVRDPTTGLWSSVSNGTVNGASGDVNAIVVGPDGKVYIGGVFASASGVANTAKIAYYDPTDGLFHAMGTGAAGGNVARIAIGPDGTVYVSGSFASMGGVANTAGLAKWNGSAWSALGSGPTGGVVTPLVVDPTGNLYAGGSFTGMGGVANTAKIAKWNGSTWSSVTGGGAANNTVAALAVAPNGNVYAGGDFTNIGGVAATRVAVWNGSVWAALGSGMPNVVGGLALAQNGILYAIGQFLTAGGITVNFAASWNGVAWSALGTGFDALVSTITIAPDGGVWFAGNFTTAGGIVLRSPITRWNGSNFTTADNDLVFSVSAQAIAFDANGKMYVGYSSFGTATAAGITAITNIGTARSYPTVTISGPSSGTARIYSLINATTNRAIYFNLLINAGETITLRFQPDNLSFTSTFQGDISGAILPGSNAAEFFLQPGANSIALLSASATVTASLYYRPAYVSLDDVP